jgi:hypothetical protein
MHAGLRANRMSLAVRSSSAVRQAYSGQKSGDHV